MENNKTSVPVSTAGGVSGGAWQQNPPSPSQTPYVSIKKYGRGMNSEKPERRYLFLSIEPFDGRDLERGIRLATDAINRLLVVWEPPIRREFFRPDMWWQHAPCPYCLKRATYEMERWKKGEYVWHRGACLRHWFVYHLSAIAPYEPSNLISNQPVSIVADTAKMLFNIETVNYRYDIMLTKEIAKMSVEYKGREYMFSFSNHLRGYPRISSYMNIMIDVYNTLELFRDFITDYVLKRRLRNNVIINDVFTIPPARDDAGNCNTCRL
jgi:hypothetical protein